MDNPKQDRSRIPGIRRPVAAMALAILLVSAVLATGSAQAQSWFDNFDSYPLGSFPSPNWQPSGNDGTSIVNSSYVYPDQSAQLYGIVGGCWGAIIYHELQVSPPYTIQFYARNGTESLSGCHPWRASMALGTSPSWTTPQRFLAGFDADGAFFTDWPSISGPDFPLLTWINVRITYEFLNAKTVRIGYWFNGKLYKWIKYTPTEYEDQLAWLGLASAEGTAWYDDISVTSGVPPSTTVTLTSSPNPSTYGQAVTFTAVVTSKDGAPPDGEAVSFLEREVVLGTGVLSGGSASFTTSSLKAGKTSLTAVYGGDSNFLDGRSNIVKQVVEKTEE